jgi:hypothetical protein
MRSRVFVALLLVLLLFPQAFACSVSATEPPKEIGFQDGIGGTCYYKRIPPDSSEQPWRTEFYLNKENKEPVFTLEAWFGYPILCVGEAGTTQHIAHVQHLDGIGYADINDSSWLSFYVDNKMVKSYSPIEIINYEDNIEQTTNCGIQYLAQDFGFAFDESLNQYVYRVATSDDRIINFDPSTENMLEAP